MTAHLHAIGWDDPRCIGPLRAALAQWRTMRGTDYAISTRPLTAFNDQPLGELAAQCDLMIIDHPHIFAAAREGAVVPLDAYVEPAGLAEIEADAIGANYRCYVVDGHPYALHADAACHVSAARDSRLRAIGAARPTSIAETIALAQAHPGAVAWPLYPTDAICSLLSILAGRNAGPGESGPFFRDPAFAAEAIEQMLALAALMEPFCWEATPQRVFAEAATRPIAYVPFCFSYLRLALEADGWHMAAPPTPAGSILGGAGIAVSARSQHVEEAAAFAAWYCQPQVLAGLVEAGAQPGSEFAWTRNSGAAAGFFADVLPVLRAAWVRPQTAWWPAAQIATGEVLAEGLRGRWPAHRIITAIERAYAASRENDDSMNGEQDVARA